MKVTKIEREPYEGMVYNLEVEEDNSYCTPTTVLHNCEIPVNQGAHFTVLKSEVFLEEVARSLNKVVPLGWRVKVSSSGVELPFGYRDRTLETALMRKLRKYPSLYGTYELQLWPATRSGKGLNILNSIVSLDGDIVKDGHSDGGCNLSIGTAADSPLASVIRRSINATFSRKQSNGISFGSVSTESTQELIPVFSLRAIKTEDT